MNRYFRHETGCLSAKRRTLAILIILIAGGAASPGHVSASTGPIACHVAGLPYVVKCGTLPVKESISSGRTIEMYYILVPAAHRNTGAIFEIGGGPGQSAAELAPALGGTNPAQSLLQMHADHDLIFADQRGTGRSHPLQCPELFASRQSSFQEIYPSAPLRACRARLAKTSDLRAYGTSSAVDDLDALRSALGYRTISIDTGSYGSQVAFEYLRRHPMSLRSVLLEAVVPTYAKVPLPFTRAAQHALDELQASCVADASCAKAFPNFSSEWTEVNRRFAGGPQRVTFQDAHGMTTAMLSREVFADSVRHVLYSQFFAAALPAANHAAARNDYGPLAMLIATQIDETKTVLAFGMFFSVTCSEDVVFITPQETEAAKSLGFLGDLRIRGQQRACAIWNVRSASKKFLSPVRSNVPVLMISGADDPAAPAWLGASQLPYLSDARQVIVVNGGHSNGDPCLTRMRVAFISNPDPRRVRASCATQYWRPPFVTDFAAWYAKYFTT
ncbi:MAG TPA: alpha/beta hydrolase [Candidatus Cybelea sp.]|nr:alpha/beta hydrolase [Candidatus Cybelea sp.]